MGNVKNKQTCLKTIAVQIELLKNSSFHLFFSSIEEIVLIIIAVNSYIEDCIVFKQEKEVV